MRWFCGLTLAVLCSPVVAEDWPQLQGPNRNGTTSETVEPWTTPPKVLWRKKVDESAATPAVTNGRVFLHCMGKNTEEETLYALDAATGEVLWQKSYPRQTFKASTGSGPRGGPTVVLDRVYVHGITGILTCYAAADGKQLWQVDTRKKFNGQKLGSGTVGNPVVEGNRVLITMGGGPGASIAAFDTDTGELAWKALDDPISSSTPTLYLGADGSQRQVVFQTGLRFVGVNPTDGTILWQHKLSDTPIGSGAPLTALHGDLLFASSVQYGGIALKVEKTKDRSRANVVWRNETLGAYFPDAVPVGKDHLYIVTNTSNTGTSLRCVSLATGKELWSEPGMGDWHAGLIGLGDNKLLLHDGKGNLRLVAHDPAKYHELARAHIGIEGTLSHPAYANGRFYVRNLDEIVCVQLGKSAGEKKSR